MELETKWQLEIGNSDLVYMGEKIKVALKNGEVLIGEYSHSDWTSLTIERESSDIDIDFEDIKDIERIID